MIGTSILNPIAIFLLDATIKTTLFMGPCPICRVASGYASSSQTQFAFELVSRRHFGHSHRLFVYAFTAISI